MATYVLKDCKLYVDKYDLSTRWSAGRLECKTATPDATLYGSSSKVYGVGLKSHALTFSGLHDNTTTLDPDSKVYPLFDSASTIVTVGPTDGTDGEVAYFFKASQTSYTPLSGTVGDMTGFTINASGSEVLGRGTILKNATSNVTTNGTGTAYNLGAVGATETVYAAVHVHYLDGGTLDLAIQSDDNESMTSATERIGFTNATATTSEWKTASGAITDTWWRVSWTYDGTACKFVVTMMIT